MSTVESTWPIYRQITLFHFANTDLDTNKAITKRN